MKANDRVFSFDETDNTSRANLQPKSHCERFDHKQTLWPAVPQP